MASRSSYLSEYMKTRYSRGFIDIVYVTTALVLLAH